MGNFIDLTGKTFGRLYVINHEKQNNKHKWLCKCSCGKYKEILGMHLRTGHTQSCGCYGIEMIKKTQTKHGQSINRTPEYAAWKNLKNRALNKKYKRYKDWGGRGIIVCERWLNSFDNFFKDMGKRPSKNHSVDRFPNNDGIYEASNCRWATPAQQNRGKRNNRWFEINGERMILSDWAKRFGACHSNLIRFLKKKSFEEAYNFYMDKQVNKSRQHT